MPFFGFGSSGGSLRNVDDGASRVDLPSPPLLFGSSTFTTAFVSVFNDFYSALFMSMFNHR